MSHIFKKSEIRFTTSFKKPVIAVKVIVGKKQTLIVEDKLPVVCKSDTVWAELPKRILVLSKGGRKIKSSGKLYISVETINPFHLITDQNENICL